MKLKKVRTNNKEYEIINVSLDLLLAFSELFFNHTMLHIKNIKSGISKYK